MKTRFLAALASAMLLGSLLAPSVSAVTLQTNLAGRPLNGNTVLWCTGVAYGRVNGAMVIFTANHCADGRQPGDYVYGATGQPLGTWGSNGTSTPYDLAWIKLLNGNWPTVPYQIYRGDCSDGTCPGGTSSYWTVDNLQGSNDYSCANAPLHTGADVWENWRTTVDDHSRARLGEFLSMGPTTAGGGWSTPCMLQTNLLYSTTYKHSGAGLVAHTGEVLGVATSVDGSGRLRFSNFREAITRLDNALPGGAYLCTGSLGNDCL